MKTEYVKCEGSEKEACLLKAAEILKEGGLVAFPTETVYGLGGNGLNPASSKKIYEAKGRPSDNPLILHISDFSMLKDLVAEIPKSAVLLAETFWPGPMTLVFKKSALVPYETTGGLDTVAVRLPSNEIARALIKKAGVPIAAPSANSSGRPSPTKASHVREDLDGKIDMILDGGEVGIGLESTIIDVTVEPPMILRHGYITKEMLQPLFSEVAVDLAATGEKPKGDFKPKAPGMKYKHYAPKGNIILYEGERAAVIREINRDAELAKKEGFVTAVLATEESKEEYKADYVLSLGKRTEPEEIAHNLFDSLRKFDEIGAERIFSESFGSDGLFEAVMNRLNKAAGYQRKKVN